MMFWTFACRVGGGPDLVEGHRGGTGYWPENSRTAVVEAGAAGVQALSLEVVLAEGEAPVLQRGRYLEAGRCRSASGEALPFDVDLRDVPEGALDRYACGGQPDPAWPNALVVDEPPLSVTELVELLPEAPNLQIRLDVKEPGRAEVVAAEVLDRWLAVDLPNTLVVSSDDPEVLAAFVGEGRARGREVPVLLRWPAPGPPDAGQAAQLTLEGFVNAVDYVAIAEEAGADGLVLDGRWLDPALARAARREGYAIWSELVDPEDTAVLGQLTVDVLSTPLPGDAP